MIILVKSNIPVIMAKNSIRTITELSIKTGVSRGALTALYYSNSKGVQFDTLEKLCDCFNCGVGDILIYKKGESA